MARVFTGRVSQAPRPVFPVLERLSRIGAGAEGIEVFHADGAFAPADFHQNPHRVAAVVVGHPDHFRGFPEIEGRRRITPGGLGAKGERENLVEVDAPRRHFFVIGVAIDDDLLGDSLFPLPVSFPGHRKILADTISETIRASRDSAHPQPPGAGPARSGRAERIWLELHYRVAAKPGATGVDQGFAPSTRKNSALSGAGVNSISILPVSSS